MGFFSFLGDLVGSIGSALFGGETGRIVSSVGNVIGAQAAANDQNRYISSANDASRRFTLDMYNLQRRDALSDWQMQNEYNSPAAQMKRFIDAGLNPNLIYGNLGSSVAANVRPSSPSTGGANFQPKNALAFYDIMRQQSQAGLANSTIALNSARELLLAQQTAGQASKNALLAERVPYAKELAKVSMDAARNNLEKLSADIMKTNAGTSMLLSEDVRRDAYLSIAKDKSKAQIDEIKKRMDVLEKDAELKRLEIQMRNKGLTFNDALWQRLLGQFLLGENSIQDLRNAIGDFLKNGISIF